MMDAAGRPHVLQHSPVAQLAGEGECDGRCSRLLLADRGHGAQLLWRARHHTVLPGHWGLADDSYCSRYGDGPVHVAEYTLAEAPNETGCLVTTLLDPKAGPASASGSRTPRSGPACAA